MPAIIILALPPENTIFNIFTVLPKPKMWSYLRWMPWIMTAYLAMGGRSSTMGPFYSKASYNHASCHVTCFSACKHYSYSFTVILRSKMWSCFRWMPWIITAYLAMAGRSSTMGPFNFKASYNHACCHIIWFATYKHYYYSVKMLFKPKLWSCLCWMPLLMIPFLAMVGRSSTMGLFNSKASYYHASCHVTCFAACKH